MTFSQWDLVPHVGKRVVLTQRGLFKERSGLLATVTSNPSNEPYKDDFAVAVLRVEGDESGSGAPYDVLVAVEAIDSIEVHP